MLKLKNNNNLRIIFVKKNEKYFGMFWNIQFLKMKSTKLINRSIDMC
jgi:hypothetical protein